MGGGVAGEQNGLGRIAPLARWLGYVAAPAVRPGSWRASACISITSARRSARVMISGCAYSCHLPGFAPYTVTSSWLATCPIQKSL